jgi:hypothetical protein
VSADTGRPDFATLLDWLEDRLDPDAAVRVAAQVAQADQRTLRTLDWLRGFLTTARTLPLHEPPPIVRQSLSQHFARWSRAQAELDQQPRQIRVHLLFDSRQDLAMAGVRAGCDADDAVHLAYACDEGDLLLDIYGLGTGQARIDGQVLLSRPEGAPIFEASVARAGAGQEFMVRTKDGDELGRFSLPGVPEVACQIRATNGLVAILADLDLSPGGERR